MLRITGPWLCWHATDPDGDDDASLYGTSLVRAEAIHSVRLHVEYGDDDGDASLHSTSKIHAEVIYSVHLNVERLGKGNKARPGPRLFLHSHVSYQWPVVSAVKSLISCLSMLIEDCLLSCIWRSGQSVFVPLIGGLCSAGVLLISGQ